MCVSFRCLMFLTLVPLALLLCMHTWSGMLFVVDSVIFNSI